MSEAHNSCAGTVPVGDTKMTDVGIKSRCMKNKSENLLSNGQYAVRPTATNTFTHMGAWGAIVEITYATRDKTSLLRSRAGYNHYRLLGQTRLLP